MPEAVWITAEIAELSINRGHYYFSLVQKSEDSDAVIAKAEGVIWQSVFRRLRRKAGLNLEQLLREGSEVLLKAQPEYHERFGFKLLVEDLDPSYTLGKLELKRQQILQELARLKLLDRNQQLPLPRAMQRFAILSSPQAAGLQDFMQQLNENSYGYSFKTTLFPIAVQGQRVEEEMLQALKRITKDASAFDAVLILRGGGSKLDLAAFDSLALAKAVALLPLPFLSGIGHDINQTILDQVAHTALKTPTAVADFLIQHNLQLEFQLNEWALFIRNKAAAFVQAEQFKLVETQKKLDLSSKRILEKQQLLVNYVAEEIPKWIRFRIKQEEQHIAELDRLRYILSPEATLQRGYSITLKDNKPIGSTQDLKKGERISTRFKDGSIDSEII